METATNEITFQADNQPALFGTDFRTINDTEKLTFTNPRKMQGSPARMMNVSFERKSISVCTPMLYCPFGISSFDEKYDPKLTVNVRGPTNQKATSIEAEFYTWLETMDAWLRELVVTNWKSFIGSNVDPIIIRSYHTPILKEPKNLDYPYSVKFPCKPQAKKVVNTETKKVEIINGKELPPEEQLYGFKVYDRTTNPNNTEGVPCTKANAKELIPAGSFIRILFDISSVYFVDKRFGWTLKIRQVEVLKLGGYQDNSASSEFTETPQFVDYGEMDVDQ